MAHLSVQFQKIIFRRLFYSWFLSPGLSHQCACFLVVGGAEEKLFQWHAHMYNWASHATTQSHFQDDSEDNQSGDLYDGRWHWHHLLWMHKIFVECFEWKGGEATLQIAHGWLFFNRHLKSWSRVFKRDKMLMLCLWVLVLAYLNSRVNKCFCSAVPPINRYIFSIKRISHPPSWVRIRVIAPSSISVQHCSTRGPLTKWWHWQATLFTEPTEAKQQAVKCVGDPNRDPQTVLVQHQHGNITIMSCGCGIYDWSADNATYLKNSSAPSWAQCTSPL